MITKITLHFSRKFFLKVQIVQIAEIIAKNYFNYKYWRIAHFSHL